MEEMERIESEGHNDRTDSRDRDLERGEGAMVFVEALGNPVTLYNGFLSLGAMAFVAITNIGYLSPSSSSAAMAFVVNPYCVAAMPEEIRKGFLKKVLGIVSSQLLYLMLIILLFRYLWVEDVKTTVITAANQSLIDASGGELGQVQTTD